MVRQVLEQSQVNQFANMLENIFAGKPDVLMATPLVLSEKGERVMAIKRVKPNKSADEQGSVAELLSFVFEEFPKRVLEFSMASSILQKYPLPGAKLFSICCQNMAVRRFLLSTGPLKASAFCTRHLFT